MLCPSAPSAIKQLSSSTTRHERNSKGNYAACMGAGTYYESIDGNPIVDEAIESSEPTRKLLRGAITVNMIPGWQNISGQDDPNAKGSWKFGRGKGVKLRRIKDGVSKTIVASEVLTFDGDASDRNFSEDIRGVWSTPSMGGSTYSHMYGPNSTVNDKINGCEADIPATNLLACQQQPASGQSAGETFASARSQHNGGVVSGRGDGSVGFFSDDTDINIWHALATRAGGDVSDVND